MILGINSVLLGILTAGLSLIVVLGSFLLALTEGGQALSYATMPTLESVETYPSPTIPSPTFTTTATPTTTITITSSPTSSPTSTMTPTLVSSTCIPPEGWTAYTIKQHDTLRNLAEPLGLTPQQLADANCLLESRLSPGSVLYLPPESPTATIVTCSPPLYWVTYVVQTGDTLFDIALRASSTVDELLLANCLTSTSIHTGQRLYVPRQPLPFPNPTSLPPTSPPLPATSTPGPLPTATPTDSNITNPQPTITPVTPDP